MELADLEKIKSQSGELMFVSVEGIGIVLGTIDVMDHFIILKKPRIMQTKTQPTGKVEIRFAEMLGKPDEISLIRPPIFLYKAADLEIINHYQQATSPIQLVPAHGLKVLNNKETCQ